MFRPGCRPVIVRIVTTQSLAPRISDLLRCPACGSRLDTLSDELRCIGAACRRTYPVVDGAPILIDDEHSILQVADYRPGAEHVLYSPAGTGARSRLRRLAQALYRRLPEVTRNLNSRENYAAFARLLLAQGSRPLVLVIGGREPGKGMADLRRDERIDLLETDIDVGPSTRLVCDAHQLPFADGSVDGIVAQAVLEHVLDPHRCVAEIHRVLRRDGLVYAETPFVYRRHGGPFDFSRFTFLGHRRLFRRFQEVSSGLVVGPGSALAVTYMGVLLCFTRRRALRAALRVFGILSSFWLKYLDPLLARNDASLDVAGGFWLLARKSDAVLTDRELIAGFRGMR
jgi:SAM-dependent methyltransferase